MALPFSIAKKLRIQFRKSVRKGDVKNAELDPAVPQAIVRTAEPDESFIVRVDRTKGGYYWFSDRRLLYEDDNGIHELFRYHAVRKAHWMFKGLWEEPGRLLWMGQTVNLKRDNYDRLEIETQEGLTVLENLGQAYWPTLHFLWWINMGKSQEPVFAKTEDYRVQ